jgi:glutamate racemase
LSNLTKIGVFDSGIGGLSVLNEALLQSPHYHYLYLADSYFAPYGEKTPQWVEERSLKLCTWLIHQGCEVVVVACNTATAQAIAVIRETFPTVPIVGVEPGIKPAAKISEKKIVGVLATQNTLESEKFKLLLESLGNDCEFISQAGSGLVPLIEEGELAGPRMESLLIQYIEPMLKMGADTLVLGCTHYPFLQATIAQLFQDRLDIIDTSEAVVKQLNRQLLPSQANHGALDFYSTKDGDELLQLAHKLLTHPGLTHAHSHTVTIV